MTGNGLQLNMELVNSPLKKETLMKELTVELTFTEELLGTTSADKELYSRFIASKAPNAKTITEEIEEYGVEEVTEKGMTGFNRLEDGRPFVYDYWIKGFFKGAAGFLRKVKGTESEKIKSYKKEIDGLIFVKERKIPLELPEGGEIGICERPLRAQTMQGERVALSKSEAAPEGTKIRFTIVIFKDDLYKAVIEWLDYGIYTGMGQWRNSGKGRFTWREIEK